MSPENTLLGKATLTLVNRLRQDAGEAELCFSDEVVADYATVLYLLGEAMTYIDRLILVEPADADALRTMRFQLTNLERQIRRVLRKRTLQ